MTDEITLDAPETRLERFLAAAAGMDGIALDEPETRVEKYLYKIAQGSGGVPAVEDADKGKYLHANESTGDLEWAAAGGGGGGGVLVVNAVAGESFPPVFTLDKTWKEIKDAADSGSIVVVKSVLESTAYFSLVNVIDSYEGEYTVEYFSGDSEVEDTIAHGIKTVYTTNSEDGYPSTGGGGGGGGGA